MRHLLTILILVGFFYLGKTLFNHYKEVERRNAGQDQFQEVLPAIPGADLPGMPASLEPALENARKQGASGLATFLRQYRHAIRDPRLAQIELDYVVLVNVQDPAEARRVFKSVQQRTLSSSPVYERMKRLEKSFQ